MSRPRDPVAVLDRQRKRDLLVKAAILRLAERSRSGLRALIPGTPGFDVKQIAAEVIWTDKVTANAKTVEGWVRAAGKRGAIRTRDYGPCMTYYAYPDD